jgi:caa(3)-type oxidase subunit IV
MTTESHGYGTYWLIWIVLLVLTVLMIVTGDASLSGPAKAVLLLLGSAVKASLIIFFFMHMRFERAGLVLTVLVGIFLTSVLMFALPAYDGSNVFQHLMYP